MQIPSIQDIKSTQLKKWDTLAHALKRERDKQRWKGALYRLKAKLKGGRKRHIKVWMVQPSAVFYKYV